MRVVFLGTAGYHPNESRQTACVMVPELGIVFDAGTGFFRVRDYLETPELHVFLSHYHWDHVIGLTFLIDVAYGKDLCSVHCYGRDPIRHTLRRLFRDPFFPVGLAQHSCTVRCHGVSDARWARQGRRGWQIGDALVSALLCPHPSGGSFAYALTARGRKIVYITDTTVSPALTSFVADADLLICEANFPNAFRELALKTGHSYPEIVAGLARDAHVKRLVLFHVSPLLPDPEVLVSEAREIFSGPIDLAHDRMEIDV